MSIIFHLPSADHDFLAADQGLPAVHRGDGAQPAAHLVRRPRHQGEGLHAAVQRHRRRQEQRLRRGHGAYRYASKEEIRVQSHE